MKLLTISVDDPCYENISMNMADRRRRWWGGFNENVWVIPNEALKQLLCYMEDSTYGNAVNDDLKEIHGMVEIVRKDPEMSIKYLRMQEKLRRSEAEGEAAGKRRMLVTQVCKKVKKNQSLEKIAEDPVEEISVIEPIYDIAVKSAPEYDPEQVLEEMEKP